MDSGAREIDIESIQITVDPAKATAGILKINEAFAKLHEGAEKTKERIHHTFSHLMTTGLGAVGLGLGFHELASKVVEANEELENIEKSLGGTLLAMESWNKAIPVAERVTIAMKEATEVASQLDEVEGRLAMPMQDLSAAYSQLAFVGFKRLGKSQAEVLEMTTHTAEAAKVMGMSAQGAGQLIERAFLTRTVRGFGPLQDALREALKGAKKLSEAEVWKRINSQLAGLRPAADRMSEGFGNTMFRIRDFLEDTLRDVGKPVFGAISEQLLKWKKHIEDAKAAGNDILAKFGDKLVSGFKTLVKLSETLLDHWKLIAGIFAANKMASGIGGMAGALSGVLGESFGGGEKGKLAGLAGAAGKFATQLGIAGAAAFLLGSAFEALMGKMGERDVKQADKASKLESFVTKAAEWANGSGMGMNDKLAKMAFGQLRQVPGLMPDKKHLDRGEFASMWAAANYKQRAALANIVAPGESIKRRGDLAGDYAGDKIADAFIALLERTASNHPELFKTSSEASVHPSVKPPPVQNFGDVYITQDFKDQDPDRVFVSFQRGLEGLADNPKQSSMGSPFPY